MQADPSSAGTTRDWALSWYGWETPGVYYHPLYFEEVNLERYGPRPCGLRWVQPVISGAHFFATVPILPYKLGAQPPWQHVDPAEYGGPGCLRLLPWSLRGAAAESAAVAGIILLF
jgi:hypothetical protein